MSNSTDKSNECKCKQCRNLRYVWAIIEAVKYGKIKVNLDRVKSNLDSLHPTARYILINHFDFLGV